MLRKYKDAIVGGLVILAAVGLFAASLTIQSLSLNLIKADFIPKQRYSQYAEQNRIHLREEIRFRLT